MGQGMLQKNSNKSVVFAAFLFLFAWCMAEISPGVQQKGVAKGQEVC